MSLEHLLLSIIENNADGQGGGARDVLVLSSPDSDFRAPSLKSRISSSGFQVSGSGWGGERRTCPVLARRSRLPPHTPPAPPSRGPPPQKLYILSRTKQMVKVRGQEAYFSGPRSTLESARANPSRPWSTLHTLNVARIVSFGAPSLTHYSDHYGEPAHVPHPVRARDVPNS